MSPILIGRLPCLAGALVLIALLGGCAGSPGIGGLGPKQTVGALAGAGAGALAGTQIGGGRGQLIATSVGTLLGAVVGSEVGKSLDRADQAAAGQAQAGALEFAPTGQQVAWQNPDTGHYGSVTPTRTFTTGGGTVCRDFSHNATIDGRLERVSGTACRDASGQWRAVGS
jgi:surface antigen